MSLTASFSDLTTDERLRLFAWATSPSRHFYLAVLRAFDDAREAYVVQLRPADVATRLDREEDDDGEMENEPESLTAALDVLADFGVLERAQDAKRVASISEYKRRRPIYQFTELGYHAFRNVDDVVRMRAGEAELQRFAFSAICEDLVELAAANVAADGPRTHRVLDRLDVTFTRMADKAAQFYVMMGQLSQQHEANPEIFLEYKDLLLSYLQEFLAELQRYRPLVIRQLENVRETGIDDMIDRVANVDDASPFIDLAERTIRWRARWDGLCAWFLGAPGFSAAADDLDRRTTTAISDLSALLRRVTETRNRGISRSSELQHLARWFAATEHDDDAHSLFAAVFGLTSVRHLSLVDEDAEPIAPSTPWREADPVIVPTTLRRRGQMPPAGRPGAIVDLSAAQRTLRERRHFEFVEAREAVERLATHGLADRVLDRHELAAFLRLVNRALRTRVTVSGALGEATHERVRLRLRESASDTVVATVDGTLALRGIEVEVTQEGVSA